MLARRFEADGQAAKAVGDANELLAAVGSGGVTSVILDPMLPGNAGYAVLARLRAAPGGATLPVLVLSTNDSPEAMEAAKRAGVVHYAIKGRETPAQLVTRMRKILGIETAAPYFLSVRAEIGDGPRLAQDLHVPGLKCPHCQQQLFLVLEGDPQSGGYTLSANFACRRCVRATPPPSPSPLPLIVGKENSL